MDSESEDEEEIPQLVEVLSDITRTIPVTVLAGFLGSGKTTLLNHILTESHGKRIAVIENEFGEGLGIESMIAKSGVDGNNISDFFELANGCICCTVKDSLVSTLEQLIVHKDRFDYILIETTGLANPGPVVSALWTDDVIGNSLRLDGVVCVVDCLNLEMYLQSEDISSDVRTQLCFADRILLNKSDLVTAEKMEQVKALVDGVNSFAQIQTSTYSKVNLDFVLNTGSYATDDETGFLQCLPCTTGAAVQSMTEKLRALTVLSQQAGASSSHLASEMKTQYLQLAGAFHLKRLEVLLDSLLYSEQTGGAVHGGKFGAMEVDVDAATSPQSHGTTSSGGEMRIFRLKGIVHIAGSDKLYVLQAVHNIFELQPSPYSVGSPEDTTNGLSSFVFIGKHLDMQHIESELTKCLQP